jgi:hypothetical protein
VHPPLRRHAKACECAQCRSGSSSKGTSATATHGGLLQGYGDSSGSMPPAALLAPGPAHAAASYPALSALAGITAAPAHSHMCPCALCARPAVAAAAMALVAAAGGDNIAKSGPLLAVAWNRSSSGGSEGALGQQLQQVRRMA